MAVGDGYIEGQNLTAIPGAKSSTQDGTDPVEPRYALLLLPVTSAARHAVPA
jgi:hypothetical protein